MSAPNPAARPYIRQRVSGPYWYGKWSRNGKPVVRALGRAWVEPDGAGGWKRKRGAATDGSLTEAQASVRMLELVREHHHEQSRNEQDADERRRRGVTFRELTQEWLVYLEREKGAKPSTLSDYSWMLAEPGAPHKRGAGKYPGLLMAALGDRAITEISGRDVSGFLRSLDESGAKPRTVNKYRQLISAAFNYAMRDDAHGLTMNPAAGASKRKEPPKQVLDFYEPAEVELLARTAARGAHRWVERVLAGLSAGNSLEEAAAASRVPLVQVAAELDVNPAFALQVGTQRGRFTGPATDAKSSRRQYLSAAEADERRREDEQDADLYRIAAYTGMRLGELRALRWEDVHMHDRRLIVHRAFSVGVEGPTKSWQARYLPLADGAAAAFQRLAARDRFVEPDDYVFCSRLGRPLDGAALRRRFKRAASAAGLRVLRFHALRHGAGSLIAREADARWVQGFLGHSKLATTERYLHAKARPEDVDRLNRAFASAESGSLPHGRALKLPA